MSSVDSVPAERRTIPDNPGRVHSPRDRKRRAIKLLAAGYTTRAIRRKMIKEGFEPYEEVELIQMRQRYAPEISDLQESHAIDVFDRGLARRSERVRRLTILAERLEDELEEQDLVPLKVSKEYRATLAQIGAETDPLGLSSPVDPKDPWVILISKLFKIGEAQQLPSSTQSQKPSELNSPTSNEKLLSVEVESNSLPEESVEVKVGSQHSS